MDGKTSETAADTSEASIQSAIMHALGKRRDCVVFRNPVGSALHTDQRGHTRRVAYGAGGTGAPDLIAEVKCGPVWVCVWLEVKTAEGRLRPEQTVWHEAARSRGRHAYVVRSVDDALRAVAEVQALAGSVPL